jgi:diguanylate cyclase (GGDEF)-like protein
MATSQVSDSARCSLLIVDDEPSVLVTLEALLRGEFELRTASSAAQAQEWFEQRPFDLILADHKMAGMSGVQLLEWVRGQHPRTIRLLMSGFANMKDAVEAINRGQIFRYLAKPWRHEELLQSLRDAARAFLLERSHEELLLELRQLNEDLEQRVQQRTLELEEANRQLQQKNAMLERLALTDELTGLPNRRAIEQFLQTEVNRRNRYPRPLALGLVDADCFKAINTQYFYPGGDEVLRNLARILSVTCRGVDTVARIGGEEFLVVAPETGHEGAAGLAERIRQAVERSVTRYHDQDIRLTVSVGFAVDETTDPVTSNQFLHDAAAALAQAKAQGRNRCVILPISIAAGQTLPTEQQ